MLKGSIGQKCRKGTAAPQCLKVPLAKRLLYSWVVSGSGGLKVEFVQLGLSLGGPPWGLSSMAVLGSSDSVHGGSGLQERVFPQTR